MRTVVAANSLKSALTVDPYHTLHAHTPFHDVNNVYYMSRKSDFQLSNVLKPRSLIPSVLYVLRNKKVN